MGSTPIGSTMTNLHSRVYAAISSNEVAWDDSMHPAIVLANHLGEYFIVPVHNAVNDLICDGMVAHTKL
jgi:hypothetical protein